LLVIPLFIYLTTRSKLFSLHSHGKVFKQELAWATHIGVSAVILPTPDWHCTNYAQTVHSTLMNLHYMKLLVHGSIL
jgi:hypothetical protein